MQVSNFTPSVCLGPGLSYPYPYSAIPQEWQWLPIGKLQNFEPVGHQFAASGLVFEEAIALCPSNPWFGLTDRDVGIMPTVAHSLKIQLVRSMASLQFGVISSAQVTLSALDTEGHCLAIAHTVPADHAAPPPYPEQILEIVTQGAIQIRLDAKAPFLLNRVALK